MLSLFSRRSSSKSSTSSSESIKDRVFALDHPRAVPKPLVSLKKKVRKLFKREKVLVSNIQFEVVLSQYAVKERKEIEAVSPKHLDALDYDFLHAMKVMFEALHDPSVLDARRHKRLGLDQCPSANQLVEVDLPSLASNTIVGGSQITASGSLSVSVSLSASASASAAQITRPTLDLAEESAPLPTFEAPLNLLCSELDYFLAMSKPLPADAAPRRLSFKVLRFLGAGTSGRVYQTRERVTNTKWALKIVPKDGKEEEYILDYVDERLIHEKLQDSPWFTSLWASWHDQSNLYFAMTLYPTALDSEIQRVNGLEAKRAKFYMCELIIGLSELHKRGILHGDLKPANILIDHEGHIVISDFGLSIDFEGQPTTAQRVYQPFWPYLPGDYATIDHPPRDPSELDFVTRGRRGSPYEMAPEIYLDQWYSFGIDWWAAAVVLYWMLTGRPPFYEYTEDGQKSKPLGRLIAENPIRWAPYDDVDDVTKSFLNRMMEKDPRVRLLPELEIPDHPYFEGINWQLMEERKIPPPWLPANDSELIRDSKSHPKMPTPGDRFSNESDPYPEFHFLSVEAQRAVHDGFQDTAQREPAPLLVPLPPLEMNPPLPDVEPEPIDLEDEIINEDDFEDITSVLSDPGPTSSPDLTPSSTHALCLEPGASPPSNRTLDESSTGHTSNNGDRPVGLWSKLKSIFHQIKLPKLGGWRTRSP